MDEPIKTVEKTCKGPCQRTKLRSFFNKNKNSKDGYTAWCSECLRLSEQRRQRKGI